MSRLLAVALLASLVLPCAYAQAAETPAGDEFRANTYTQGDQETPAVIGLANGEFVIVWKSFGQKGTQGAVYFQRYNKNGKALGDETRASAKSENVQYTPAVGTLSGNQFVIVWTSSDDGSGSGIYAQRFDADGNKLGSRTRVNHTTSGTQSRPTVSGTNEGYVITWHSLAQDGSGLGIYGQRFTSAGNKTGSEFRLNTVTTDDQAIPRVAGLVAGGFAAVWNSFGEDGSGWGIFGQRYNSSGNKVGPQFMANLHTGGDQYGAAIAPIYKVNLGYVVTWYSAGTDGSGFGIYAQRYNSSGVVLGSEFRVNNYKTGDQLNPAIAGLLDGGFVITWKSKDQDGSGYGVYARRYKPDGTAVAKEFRVNSTKTKDQLDPAIAPLADGGYVITWVSDGQDGSGYGVYAQRYKP